MTKSNMSGYSEQHYILFCALSSVTNRSCNTEEGEAWGGGPLWAVHLHPECWECYVRLEKTLLPSTFSCASVKRE